MNGKPVRLSSFRGQPVVMNFWTQACKPCLKEMPSLGQFAEVAARRGVAVLTVCADDGPTDVRATLAKLFPGREPPFTILFDPDLTVIQDKYGTTLYPETWLLDSTGIIRARFDGDRDWAQPLVFDVIEMIEQPGGCPIQFRRGQPLGPHKSVCGG